MDPSTIWRGFSPSTITLCVVITCYRLGFKRLSRGQATVRPTLYVVNCVLFRHHRGHLRSVHASSTLVHLTGVSQYVPAASPCPAQQQWAERTFDASYRSEKFSALALAVSLFVSLPPRSAHRCCADYASPFQFSPDQREVVPMMTRFALHQGEVVEAWCVKAPQRPGATRRYDFESGVSTVPPLRGSQATTPAGSLFRVVMIGLTDDLIPGSFHFPTRSGL